MSRYVKITCYLFVSDVARSETMRSAICAFTVDLVSLYVRLISDKNWKELVQQVLHQMFLTTRNALTEYITLRLPGAFNGCQVLSI